MKIAKSKYKNVKAIRLETQKYVILVLPTNGGKIASFKNKQTKKEYLLQNPSKKYLCLGKKDGFEKKDCSGFDDMFPTIDEDLQLNGLGKPLKYLDHGEICRSRFKSFIEKDKLVLKFVSKNIGYEYKKTFLEEPNGSLRIEYEITNASKTSLNVLWAGHCLLPIEKGSKLIPPFSFGEDLDVVYSSSKEYVEPYKTQYDANVFFFNDFKKNESVKYYFTNKCKTNKFVYAYSNKDRFVLEFDSKTLSYVGVWVDFGVVNGSKCIGLEPCSAGYDTVKNASLHGHKTLLKNGEKLTFYLSLYVESEI